jgi:hypothetical protein
MPDLHNRYTAVEEVAEVGIAETERHFEGIARGRKGDPPP